MKIALRNSHLVASLLEKARIEYNHNPNMMTTTAYSFTQQKTITLKTISDLNALIAERRARGCNEELLNKVEYWHLSKLALNN